MNEDKIEHFIGRQSQLNILEKAYNNLLNGQGQILLVSGEAGIGTTTLVRRFKQRLIDPYNENIQKLYLENQKHNRNASSALNETVKKAPYIVWLETRCSSFGSNVPYESLVDILSQLDKSRSWPKLDKALPFLLKIPKYILPGWENIFEDLAKLLELIKNPTKNTLFGRDAEEYIRLGCYKTLKTIALKNPLILFFDDLQWSDPAFCGLLFHLARNLISTIPILIICTYQPEELSTNSNNESFEHILNTLRLESTVNEIEVERFDINQVEEYLDSVFPHHDFSPQVISFFNNVSSGVPFHLALLKESLQEQGMIRQVGDIWCVKDELSVNRVPKKLIGAIYNRLSLLDKSSFQGRDMRGLLEYGSVQGDIINTWVLMNSLPEIEHSAMDKVEYHMKNISQSYKLINEYSAPWLINEVGNKYIFSNHMTQEVIYRELPAGQRRDTHRQLGKIFEDWAKNRNKLEALATIIADHYEKGEVYEKAISYWIIAARSAARLSAMAEVRCFCTHIMNNLMKLEVSNSPIDIFIPVQVEASLLLGHAKGFLGEPDNALTLIEQGHHLAEKNNLRLFICQAEIYYGDILNSQCQYDKALDHLLLAQKLAKELKALDKEMLVLREIGIVYKYQGDWQQALSAFEDGLKIARGLNDPMSMANLYNEAAEMLYRFGKMTEAIEYNRLALDLTQMNNDKISQARISIRQAYIHLLVGQWDKGKELLQFAEQIVKNYGDANGRNELMQGKTLLYLGRGRYKVALDNLQNYQNSSENICNQDGISYALRWSGRILIQQYKLEEAEKSIRRGLELIPEKVRDLIGDLGMIMLLRGETVQAINYLLKMADHAVKEMANVYLGVLYQRIAIGYHQMGNLKLAQEYATRAVDMGEKGGLYYLPENYLTLGRILLEQGKITEAQCCLENAQRASEAQKTVFRMKQCDVLAAQIGLDTTADEQIRLNFLKKIDSSIEYFKQNDMGLLAQETQNIFKRYKGDTK